nr:serine carboxypeptidase-like 26 [Tanacetum cinerariifolium]
MVQEVLNANRTRLSYPWSPCTMQMHHVWHDTPLNMFPFYRRLIKHGLHILLYSGDVDLIVPAISTRYGIEAFGLRTVKPWSPWSLQPKQPVAGYHVV